MSSYVELSFWDPKKKKKVTKIGANIYYSSFLGRHENKENTFSSLV
jgi:hypothetical protein